MLFQSSTLRSIPAEAWAAVTALVTGAALIAKKLLNRRPPKLKPEYITRAEFHAGMDATRDRISASHLALADKLDANHKEILSALDRQSTRLNQVETDLARVDERTKSLPTSIY